MAERLEAYERTVGPNNYPWDEWTDGSVWKIRKGSDYKTDALRTYLYEKAKERDLTVWTQKADDDQGEALIFQFSPKAETA